MHPILVIGIGISPDDLTAEKACLIANADVLAGGERLLARFEHFRGPRILIKSPLEKVFHRIEKEMLAGKRVVVMAEGDPGFFGIGRRLVQEFGQDRVTLLPNVTTLQTAASRMKKPWDGMRTVSLHGRGDIRPLMNTLVSSELTGVFTDAVFDPARIAKDLIERGADLFRMWVFESLGEQSEKIGCYDLKEAAERTFSTLNFVVLEQAGRPEVPLCFGLDDDRFIHQAGLITKKEVRAAGLASLRIEPHHIIWDLGAGCGSVSIEASILAHEGAVFAVEKDGPRAETIRENIRRMGAYGVEVVCGRMPSCLKDLPQPDRIFVGGGIGRGTDVLEEAMARLRPGGRIALHLVLLGSLEAARACLRSKAWDHHIVQIQVSRSRGLAGDERLESLNPVYIVSTTKPAGR